MGLMKARRAAVLLALASTVMAFMGVSVAQAGFRPGLIAFFKPDSGGIFEVAGDGERFDIQRCCRDHRREDGTEQPSSVQSGGFNGVAEALCLPQP
jgi:hypothetical protein